MVFKVALILLAPWLVRMSGLYDMGALVNILLLLGLMLLLLGFLRSRDAAATRHRVSERSGKP